MPDLAAAASPTLATQTLASRALAAGAPSIDMNASAAAAQKAGQDFEAFFLSQAFENMFDGLGSDPLFGGGSGENIYRSLMIQEDSKIAAKSGMTGIGTQVTREILHLQETQQRA